MEPQITPLDIIQNSILSSLYIDDKIVEPYEEITSEEQRQIHETSKQLYSSFKDEKKTLDFYKFNAQNDWGNDIANLLRTKDLLILDWSLNDALGLKQVDTLRILKQAILTDSLHFITIYTSTEEKDFVEILYSIKAFFNSAFKQDSKGIYEEILQKIDNEGIDTKFFDQLSGKFKDYSLGSIHNKARIYQELKADIQKELGNKYRIFATEIKRINPDLAQACEVFGYCVNQEGIVEELSNPCEISTNFVHEKFIVVNHTIIQITNKSKPKPSELFTFFTDAVQKVCGNLLTIVSLEIRSLLRESSGFIGKDADSIEDAILFYQKQKKGGFVDLLMSILKNHTFSSFNYKQGKLKTISDAFWESYGANKKIDDQIKALDDDTKVNQLLKLNVYYNELHVYKRSDDIVKFGDVFISLNPQEKHDGNYFLCITAHCDCLNPRENIKNNFYFLAGSRVDAKRAIDDGDGEYNSFLNQGSETIAIKWNQRPIVLKINNNKLDALKLKAQDGVEKIYDLKYTTTLKENYAQRMANNAFSFAMRVGIDFATY